MSVCLSVHFPTQPSKAPHISHGSASPPCGSAPLHSWRTLNLSKLDSWKASALASSHLWIYPFNFCPHGCHRPSVLQCQVKNLIVPGWLSEPELHLPTTNQLDYLQSEDNPLGQPAKDREVIWWRSPLKCPDRWRDFLKRWRRTVE